MGGNNGFDGKPNNDYRVKIQLDDTQSGVLKEKLKAANGSGITLNVVDGGEDVGKVLEIDFDANYITLDAKLKAGANINIADGTGADAGKLIISAPNVGKVLVGSGDTTLKYLDNAITSSDNSIQHSASGNLEDLTVPNLGKVKHNGSFKDLVEGSGIKLEESGDTLEVKANILNGTGIVITDNVGGSKTIRTNIVGEGNISVSNGYIVKDERAGETECQTATYDVAGADGDNYYVPEIETDTFVPAFIDEVEHYSEGDAYYGVAFKGIADYHGAGNDNLNGYIRVYYLVINSSTAITLNYKYFANFAAEDGSQHSLEGITSMTLEANETKMSHFDIMLGSIPAMNGKQIVGIIGGIGAHADNPRGLPMRILSVKWYHNGYVLKDSDI